MSFCHLCGKSVEGQGFIFRHWQWREDQFLRVCEQCSHQKPRCNACGIPIAGAQSSDHADLASLCVTCTGQESLHDLDRLHRPCLACGKPIENKFWEFDGLGPYCEACYRDRRACDVCSAPLTDESWQLSDGRVLCAYCHASAIYIPIDAIALFSAMKKRLMQNLGFDLNIPTGLALVDRNQLAKIIDAQINVSPEHQQGLEDRSDPANGGAVVHLDPKRTLGLYTRRGIKRGIYVQTGLPRVLFLQVAAHEYGHAWQGENCPLLRDPVRNEGIAEWVAYKVLGYYGYHRSQERMCSRQDIYGEGLRWALDLEQKQGILALMEACRKPV